MQTLEKGSRRDFLRKVFGFEGQKQKENSGETLVSDSGKAVIRKEFCISWKGGGCLTCRERCPEKAITWNRMRAPVVKEEICNGCGECVRVCPVTPCGIEIVPQE